MVYLDDIELLKSVFIMKISNNPNHFIENLSFLNQNLLFMNENMYFL